MTAEGETSAQHQSETKNRGGFLTGLQKYDGSATSQEQC